ncbi:MAG: DUF2961 domain-containing protein [Armatimonadia bacterium]|nr:DUF2961 domain-containing protein [Armatimonadia bacterium]
MNTPPLRSRLRLPCLAAIAGVLLVSTAASAKTLTYTDHLNQLTDLDRLMLYEPGVFGGQCSSFSRNEFEEWATNADAANYIRVDENGEGVMMDQAGPGCVVRIWSANPMGTIRVYLDGAEEPTYEWDFADLFFGEQAPFLEPLVYRRDKEASHSASDCYLPIPFAEHIKITSVDAQPQFYIINYLSYPGNWSVDSFDLPLSPGEEEALSRVRQVWASPGVDPKPAWADQKSIKRYFVMQPGETVNFAQIGGPGVIRAVRASIDSEQRYAWRKIVLTGAWDGADWPQVKTPLGGFFGFDWDAVEYGSLVAGYQDGEAYFYYPMPFLEQADLKLTSYLEVPAEVTFEIEYAPLPTVPEDLLYFFARWRHERDSETLDYRFLETAGQGHYVGSALSVDHPIPGWWGEGDEKVWIDGDDFPRWIGTGSEDYFGDAWGIRYLSEPTFGCTVDTPQRTTPYRWHFTDRIPFSQRLRITIENYGAWFNIEHDEFEYSSVAFWYQEELVPPFGALADYTYLGGTEYLQTPAEYHFDPESLWQEIDRAELRTTGRNVPWTLEAEDFLSGDVARGLASRVSDATLPYEYNAELAVRYSADAIADAQSFELYADEHGIYDVLLYLDATHAEPPVTLVIDGTPLQPMGGPAPGVFDLGVASLSPAGTLAGLKPLTGGDVIVDCIQIRPAGKVDDAMEIEDLEVLRTVGDVEVQASPPKRGVSAGRFLEIHASEVGDAVVFAVPEGATAEYVLGMRTMRGGKGGMVQAFVDGEAIGPAWDIYRAGDPGPGEVVPLGPVPPEAEEIEIRFVGTHPDSGFYHAGLDFFIWLPLIVHPESEDGVAATIAATHACQVRTQDLGPAYVGGHHLWVQPSNQGAYVDIALVIPESGEYELELRYTSSWDYAIAQLALDGEPLGDPVDMYSSQVQQIEPVSFGPLHLEAGTHTLRLEAMDQNPESAGYLMGLDYVKVTQP